MFFFDLLVLPAIVPESTATAAPTERAAAIIIICAGVTCTPT